MTRYLRCLFAIVVLTTAGACADKATLSLTAEDIASNNRGVGLMGYFDYEGARSVFAELARTHPNWHDVQVNLAIATLNRQQAGDEKTAMGIVQGVLQADPGNLRAQYVRGLLRLNAGQAQEALADFQAVASADPRDAYAAYYTALTMAQSGDIEGAVKNYRRAIELDPYLRSAYYGGFQALQRLQRTEDAKQMLEAFQRLADNPQARLAEFKYTRMGDKGATHVVDLASPPAIAEPQGDWFLNGEAMVGLPALVDTTATAATVADVTGDGVLDLFLPRTTKGSVLARGVGDNSFRAEIGHPLSGIAHVRTALWGDIDNDGLVDVYLLREGPNQLWRQQSAGDWQNITAASQTAGGEFDSVDGLLLDADHDGDLDILVVNADSPLELLNNNLNGSFRPLADSQQLTRPGRQVRGVVASDIDSDRDTDLLVIYASPPHDVFLNDRLWSYKASDAMAALREQPLRAAVASDVDADGRIEIYGISEDGAVLVFQPDPQEVWSARELAPPGSAATQDHVQLALADIDGDGRQEIVYSQSDGWQAASLDADKLRPAFKGRSDSPGHWLLANLSVPAGPALLATAEGEAPEIWLPGSGRHAFMGLSFSGLEEKADSMRSNASGIGTKVDLRVDSRWNSYSTLRSDSGPGQSLQPLFIGLGGYPSADYIAMTWSDGVFQTELDLQPGTLHHITETQRQLSSCPVLFAWDGQEFGFVSDLLGVGGIGFNTGFGQYAEPRPWEFFLLPENALRERDGRFDLKITEPMEEVAYLDAARLYVHWLPQGWDMIVDERMGLAQPFPTGRAVYYRQTLLPVAARNERGEDVLPQVIETDGKAAPVGPRDRRFIGRLAGQHELELYFSEPLDATMRKAWLVLDGWVEYPYSQTGFAAWQAGAEFEAPSLAAGNQAGQWVPMLEQFGYPAGMPRRMAVPLENLPEGATRLRLSTNLEVYWDRVAVVFEEAAPADLHVEELALQSAVLDAPGFPLRQDGPQRRPQYDFNRRLPLWDARHPSGLYTAFGDATELLAEHDDALVIVGPGEAVTMSFAAPKHSGKRHRLVLETRGWAKDMDLYTNEGGTVGPLPASGRDPAIRAALHKQYNTRLQSGY